ncbi:MAG: hypothetical protein K6F99_04775 [Lachnospiraceae bacterium]|nr:hypothetical protein [Lachnospiraceae bacterium]
MKKILIGLWLLMMLFLGFIAAMFVNPEFGKNVKSKLGIEETSMSENIAKKNMTGGSDSSKSSEAKPVDMTDPAFEGLSPTVNTAYNAVSEDSISVPAEYSALAGLEEVKEDGRQLNFAEAAVETKTLEVGNPGDDLGFDATLYPYYQMLNDNSKALYRQMFANANGEFYEFKPVIDNATAKELKNAFTALICDHPEVFWIETGYGFLYTPDGRVNAITLYPNKTADNLVTSIATFEGAAREIASGAAELSTPYEQEKYVHDTLAKKLSYDLGAEMNQTAYSALVNHKTVCAGYSRAFQYVMQQLKIPTYYCYGYAGENHAWNIVSLYDGYYNVDLTWDDSGMGAYAFFNKTDEDYAPTHARRELARYLPPCNARKFRGMEDDNALLEEEESEPDEGKEAADDQSEDQVDDEGEVSDDEAQEEQTETLADYGLTDKQVFPNIEEYYYNCYEQLLANGTGEYTFYNALLNEDVYNTWKNAANYDQQKGYMNPALASLGAHSLNISLKAIPVENGMYVIAHKVSLH